MVAMAVSVVVEIAMMLLLRLVFINGCNISMKYVLISFCCLLIFSENYFFSNPECVQHSQIREDLQRCTTLRLLLVQCKRFIFLPSSPRKKLCFSLHARRLCTLPVQHFFSRTLYFYKCNEFSHSIKNSCTMLILSHMPLHWLCFVCRSKQEFNFHITTWVLRKTSFVILITSVHNNIAKYYYYLIFLSDHIFYGGKHCTLK